MMKAVVIEQYGGKEQLKENEVPKPEINDEQILIEMRSTSVNPIDWKVREGYMKDVLDWSFPIILGWDAAGVVSKVGNNVTQFKEGDRVFTRPETTPDGTYKEYIAVEEHLVAHMPERVSFEEAAAAPLAGLTAWQCLFETANLKEGEKVLIHAGSGGVGHYAIQIAKAVGAYVATTASGKNKEFVETLGADHFIDYKTEQFENILEDYDVVLDTIGGDVQEKSFEVLKKGGRLVSITQQPSEELANKYNVEATAIFLQPKGEQLRKLADLMQQGKVKSIVSKAFPLSVEGIQKAHELSESHHAKGKVVIQVQPSAC